MRKATDASDSTAIHARYKAYGTEQMRRQQFGKHLKNVAKLIRPFCGRTVEKPLRQESGHPPLSRKSQTGRTLRPHHGNETTKHDAKQISNTSTGALGSIGSMSVMERRTCLPMVGAWAVNQW